MDHAAALLAVPAGAAFFHGFPRLVAGFRDSLHEPAYSAKSAVGASALSSRAGAFVFGSGGAFGTVRLSIPRDEPAGGAVSSGVHSPSLPPAPVASTWCAVIVDPLGRSQAAYVTSTPELVAEDLRQPEAAALVRAGRQFASREEVTPETDAFHFALGAFLAKSFRGGVMNLQRWRTVPKGLTGHSVGSSDAGGPLVTVWVDE